MTFWQDVRFAARLLLRDRWFTLAAVVTLALGIAANNTVFTMVNAVLLREMPFDQPDRIVEIGTVSHLDLQDMRAGVRTFEELAAVADETMSVADQENGAERYLGAYISANGLRAIRARPILGRDFRDEDDRAGAAPVVILGYDVWHARYGSAPDIVGRVIRVNSTPTTVIGVMPEGFGFPQTAVLWQPLALERSELLANRGAVVLNGFGRMRAGVTRDQARADLAAVITRLQREYPEHNRTTPPPVTLFRSGVGTDTALTMVFLFMMGAVGFVLLIACGNVANLLLVRAAGRAREMSVRVSMGATRWRIVRQLLVESTLLAIVAGVGALALSAIGLRVLWRVILETGDTPPYWLAFTIDARVLTFFAVVCLGTAICAGLAPAFLASHANIANVLNESGRTQAGSRSGRRWTSAFVIGQLALTLVLLSGAGLMMRSLLRQVRVDAGIETSQLMMLRLDLPPSYATPGRRQAFYRDVGDRFAATSRLRATYASHIPLGGVAPRQLVTDGNSSIEPERQPSVGQITIGPNYFETLGTRAVRGRTFIRRDTAAANVAIVNERLAAMYFPGEEPIGRQLRLIAPSGSPAAAVRPEWLTIVGVAPNIRQRSTEGGDFDSVVYVPVGVNAAVSMNIITRSDTDPGGVATIVRDQIRAIDPDLPLFNIRSVDDQLAFLRWPQRVFGSMFAIFATIAFALGIVGLYTITAYGASQRTREIGVRVALGARPRDIRWLVTRAAAAQLSIGVVLGVAGGTALSRVMPAQMIGASGGDPSTLAGIAALLVATALIACLIPARRAARVNPAIALRAE